MRVEIIRKELTKWTNPLEILRWEREKKRDAWISQVEVLYIKKKKRDKNKKKGEPVLVGQEERRSGLADKRRKQQGESIKTSLDLKRQVKAEKGNPFSLHTSRTLLDDAQMW